MTNKLSSSKIYYKARCCFIINILTLNAQIATKVICFSRLLKFLRSLCGKQCGPRLDCSYRSSLFWVQAVCFYTLFVSNVRQLFAADDFSRPHFQMHFFLGALRVKNNFGQILQCLHEKNILRGYLLKMA